MISKVIFRNLFTRRGTYIIDWVARAGWIERSWKQKKFFCFFEFESQNAGKWRRRGVGARDGAPGGLRGVVRGEYNVLRSGAEPVDHAAELDDVGEQREPSAEWGEIILRNQTMLENNVNLAQTEVRADGGLSNALRRLGHLRREHCRALWLRDEPVPERRQLEHAAATTTGTRCTLTHKHQKNTLAIQ